MRSLIIDDNRQFLGAARDLLERQGIDVVGVASSSEEALKLVEDLRPDVALVDIDLGSESGFDVARLLVDGLGEKAPQVILISTYAERDFADLIAASPAIGFVAKADLSARALEEALAR